jgi:hypothetical protein
MHSLKNTAIGILEKVIYVMDLWSWDFVTRGVIPTRLLLYYTLYHDYCYFFFFGL